MTNARVFLLAMSLILPASTVANDALDRQQKIISSCKNMINSESKNGSSDCDSYIRGFLDGANIVDTIFIDHLIQNHEATGFMERALRTRAGNKRLSAIDPLTAPFCLGNRETAAEVYRTVVAKLPGSLNSVDELNEQIYRTLITEYPCKP